MHCVSLFCVEKPFFAYSDLFYTMYSYNFTKSVVGYKGEVIKVIEKQ